jgi:hypothetical protein
LVAKDPRGASSQVWFDVGGSTWSIILWFPRTHVVSSSLVPFGLGGSRSFIVQGLVWFYRIHVVSSSPVGLVSGNSFGFIIPGMI